MPFCLLASVYEKPSTCPVLRPKRPCSMGPILLPSPSFRVWHCAHRVWVALDDVRGISTTATRNIGFLWVDSYLEKVGTLLSVSCKDASAVRNTDEFDLRVPEKPAARPHGVETLTLEANRPLSCRKVVFCLLESVPLHRHDVSPYAQAQWASRGRGKGMGCSITFAETRETYRPRNPL